MKPRSATTRCPSSRPHSSLQTTFGLIYEGKRDQLFALYHRLACSSAQVASATCICPRPASTCRFHSLVRACISKQVLLALPRRVRQADGAVLPRVRPADPPPRARARAQPEHENLQSLEARDAPISHRRARRRRHRRRGRQARQGVGSRTIGWRRQIAHDPAAFDEQRTGVDGLHSILREADFVIVAVPHTPATRRLLSAAELAMMKPTAWLINVSRGPVVDEAALAAALAAPAPTTPAGAVLDVYNRTAAGHFPAVGTAGRALRADQPRQLAHRAGVCRQPPVLCRQSAAQAEGREVHGRLAADSELVRPALEAGRLVKVLECRASLILQTYLYPNHGCWLEASRGPCDSAPRPAARPARRGCLLP